MIAGTRMFHLFRLLVVLTFLSIPNLARADFDYDAYRDHLRRTRDLTAEALVATYEPFGPYQAVVPPRSEAPLFYEEIDAKLRLTDGELELLQRHDFVVSERWRQPSYGDAYEWVWHRDLPVFVSTDAILHAVHKSYDELLMSA